MAIAFNLLTSGSEDTDNTSFTTASVSPTEQVVFIAVMNFENSTTQPAIGSISGNGLTWTVVREQIVDGSGGDRASVCFWKGLGTPSSGTITVTWAGGATIRRPSWIVFETSGADTTTPIVQHNGDTSPSSVTTLTTTLSAFADATNNACIAIYGVQNNTDSNYITPHTGHTELTEAWVSYSHVGVSYQIGEDTSVGGGSWPSGRSGQIAVELAAGGAGSLTITCQLITASSTILSPSVIPGAVSVVTNLITASSTLFNPDVFLGQSVSLQLITTTSTVFSPSVNQDISVPVLSVTSTIFNPSLVYDVVVPLITTTSTLFDPSFVLNVETVTIDASSTLFNLTVTTLTTVTCDVLNAPETVYTPATDTSINVESQLLTTTSTLFDPELNQDISMAVVNVPATVNNFTVTNAGGAQNVSLEVIGSTPVINSPSITTLTTVTANVLDAPSTLLAPALKYDVEAPVIVTTSNLFEPSLEYLINMQTINTAPTVLAPRIGEEVDDGFSGAIVKANDPSPFPSGIR